VYNKIIILWLSEGSLPRTLPYVSQTKFVINMAETEFREQGTSPIITTALRKENKPQHVRLGVENGKARGE
jgi:hypothetical protein